MIVADKIAQLRRQNGWSQEELAGRLGVIVLLVALGLPAAGDRGGGHAAAGQYGHGAGQL